MKFSGQLKFPEIDHPGVPVRFVIEDTQAELVVEGESLGRWSLYDIHARRLVASAFQIDLDGTEVTFVADDPIDFAYRGVEHMAETWASMKTRRMASRSIAVRKSRQGTIPSRIEEMRAAMEANLGPQASPRQLAGEVAMPEPSRGTPVREEEIRVDWDQRDHLASIPLVGDDTSSDHASSDDVATAEVDAPLTRDDDATAALALELARIEEEKRRIAEERARLEEERRVAEQREADRIEAFRLEMQRLEAEREELRRQVAEVLEQTSSMEPPDVESLEPEMVDQDAVFDAEGESVLAPEPDGASDSIPDEEPVEDAAPEPTEEPGVVDLNDLEETAPARVREPEATPPASRTAPRAPRPVSASSRQPEPAMAAAAKDGKGGLMGAVKAAFRSGPKDHEHQFIEAPGGIGITRYVCEECGYVSISV